MRLASFVLFAPRMMNQTISMSMVAALAAIGCSSKKDGDGKAAAKGGEASGAPAVAQKDPAPPPSGSGPFAEWGMDARSKAWQGAWAGDGGSVGVKAAWSVDGGTVDYVDASGEKKLAFSVTSPCTASFMEHSASGDSGTIVTYTLGADGALITGLGDAGSKHGDHYVVCGGGSIFTFDGKTCTEWHDDFGNLASSPGECGVRQDAGKAVFFYKANGMESTDLIDGDVVWSEQLKATHATKQPDLASARKAQGV